MSYMHQEVDSTGPRGIPAMSQLKILVTDDLLGGALLGDDEEIRDDIR